ncbi:MAG: hypothetical protein GXP49_06280 [Deltaproteobacteria bacterium]|nr:hypothetical protein [Deltaproteobacteria bacterium]
MSSSIDESVSVVPFSLDIAGSEASKKKEYSDEILNCSTGWLRKFWKRSGVLLYDREKIERLRQLLPMRAKKILIDSLSNLPKIDKNMIGESLPHSVKKEKIHIITSRNERGEKHFPIEEILGSTLAEAATNIYGWHFPIKHPISKVASLLELPFRLFLLGALKELVIFDRFIGVQILRKENDGFQYLLRALAEIIGTAPNNIREERTNLKIYTCYNTPIDNETHRRCEKDKVVEALTEMVDLLRKENKLFERMTIKCFLTKDDWNLRKFSHHRYIRIGAFAWLIDPGFQAFGDKGKIIKETYCLRYRTEDAKKCEKDFKAKSECQQIAL